MGGEREITPKTTRNKGKDVIAGINAGIDARDLDRCLFAGAKSSRRV